MPFTSSTPFVHEDKTFDLLGVTLITNPSFGSTNVGAQVILNLFPYRINELGQVERPMKTLIDEETQEEIRVVDESFNKNLIFSNAYAQAASDYPLAVALTTISVALQNFINAKGM